MRSLHRLILMVAAVVSVLLVVGVYLLFSGFGGLMMQKSAVSQSQIVAQLTFSNMYQLMSQGWKRDQVIAFTRSAVESLDNTPMQIDFFRGEAVSRQYGHIAQAAVGEDLAKALRSGRAREIATEMGGRYIYPLVAEEKCLACHREVKKGDVLGAITVEARYDRFIDDSRKLLMLILLILTPTPFLAAWLVTLYMDSRMTRFAQRVDAALDQAESSGGPADFSQVEPSWHELDEILDRFKRMAGRSV